MQYLVGSFRLFVFKIKAASGIAFTRPAIFVLELLRLLYWKEIFGCLPSVMKWRMNTVHRWGTYGDPWPNLYRFAQATIFERCRQRKRSVETVQGLLAGSIYWGSSLSKKLGRIHQKFSFCGWPVHQTLWNVVDRAMVSRAGRVTDCRRRERAQAASN